MANKKRLIPNSRHQQHRIGLSERGQGAGTTKQKYTILK